MSHIKIIRESAEKYSERLLDALPEIADDALSELAYQTVKFTESALSDGEFMEAASVGLRLKHVEKALASDPDATMDLMVNELSLGLGAERPKAIFLGKEAAFGDAHPVNFLLEVAALAGIWLCRGNEYIIQKLLNRSLVCADLLRSPAMMNIGTYQDVSKKSGHNWSKISTVLRAALGENVSCFDWGEHAYIVDLCHVPSTTHVGAAPSHARVMFLASLCEALRDAGARSLVMNSQDNHHNAAQMEIAARFLDVPLDCLSEIRGVSRRGEKKQHLVEYWESNSIRVVRCRHLSNSISDDHCRDVGYAMFS